MKIVERRSDQVPSTPGATTMSLEPPPSQDYITREELLLAVRRWSAGHGYAMTIQRSKPGKVYLQCDRGGKYRNTRNLISEQRRRATGSRAINCPFSVVGTQVSSGQWFLYTREETHNHDASTTLAAHPILRRLNDEEKSEVTSLTQAGVSPRIIAGII